MFQEGLETLSTGEIAEIQLAGLRRILSAIEGNNPLLFEKVGRTRAGDIVSLEDIRKLPFMTKGDMQKAYPLKFACVDQRDIVRVHMSSGTTGTPVVAPYTAADVRCWGEVMARCLGCAGVTRSDVIQITPSFGLPVGGFGFHYGAEMMGAMVVPTGAGRTSYQLKLIADFGTTVLGSISSYPLRMMEVAREEGFDFRKTRLRTGVIGSEQWSDGLRARIEEGMGIETFDIIGMTETGGVGMGVDCGLHAGIHIWEDHYLVEVIDPEACEPVPDGEEGELVVTTLKREALPVIRFRTRDITKIVSRERCGCGRTHLRVGRFKGRTDDMIIVKGVNFYPSVIESIILKEKEVALDYQIALDRDAAGVENVKLKVEVVASPPDEVRRRLDNRIYNTIGMHIPLEFVPQGSLPRPPGKAVRVVDRR